MKVRRHNKIHVSGKMVGWVESNTFYKKIQGSKHLLKKPPAIAFDTISIQIAIQYGADRIRVLDKETDIVYSCVMRDFELNQFSIDRGYGRQVAMVLNKWEKSRRVE